MNLESRTATSSKSQEELYNFLIQVENFKHLMPEDTKFETKGEDKFLFGLKGMPEIKLGIKEKHPHNLVVLGSTSDKLEFTLSCFIEPAGDASNARLVFAGDFNPMMSMMIKGPIKKFLEQLANGIERV
jgi:hypothetical protein